MLVNLYNIFIFNFYIPFIYTYVLYLMLEIFVFGVHNYFSFVSFKLK